MSEASAASRAPSFPPSVAEPEARRRFLNSLWRSAAAQSESKAATRERSEQARGRLRNLGQGCQGFFRSYSATESQGQDVFAAHRPEPRGADTRAQH